MIKDLIVKNRSYRRFQQDIPVGEQTLIDLIEIARLTPSGSNKQPLKYILSADEKKNTLIFPTLAWAGYLKEWDGPVEGEKPSAYIVILQDKNILPNAGVDHGIAAQSILLAATEMGLGGCMIGSIDKKELTANLQLAEHLEILLVIALGKPDEEVVIEPVGQSGDIKYWRDENGVHHVPKRALNNLIIT